MTKEQAIKIINDLIQNGFTNFGGSEPLSAEETDAFEIAIKALEQQPSEDCVSRERVVKAMTDWYFDMLEGEEKDFINILDDLPPVTPTHGTCKDCEQGQKCEHGVYCTNLGGTNEESWYCKDFEKRGSENG